MQVFNDPEIDRILALPKRPVPSEADKEEIARILTAAFRVSTSTRVLKPIQGWALAEAHTHGKLMGLLGAGAGKTDCTALLPNIFKAKRTLILVPAALRQKTLDDFAMLRANWIFPACFAADEASMVAPGDPVIRVLSYESLSTVNYATFIEEFDPELIIADEAHALQSMKSGRARRVFRFIKLSAKRKARFTTFR